MRLNEFFHDSEAVSLDSEQTDHNNSYDTQSFHKPSNFTQRTCIRLTLKSISNLTSCMQNHNLQIRYIQNGTRSNIIFEEKQQHSHI